MVFRRIQGSEVLEVGLDFRAVCDFKPDGAEQGFNSLQRARHGVQTAARLATIRATLLALLCGATAFGATLAVAQPAPAAEATAATTAEPAAAPVEPGVEAATPETAAGAVAEPVVEPASESVPAEAATAASLAVAPVAAGCRRNTLLAAFICERNAKRHSSRLAANGNRPQQKTKSEKRIATTEVV